MEPKTLHAGDSVTWAREAPAYPSADGWSLCFALRGPGSLDVFSTDGEPYQFRMTSSQTRPLPPGPYHWACYAIRDDDRATLASGRMEILADLLQAETFDGRSHARRTLDLIEAAIEKRIPKDQQGYEIDGMKLERIPIERLEALRTRYRREVAAERRKGQSPFGRISRVRM